MAGRVGRSLQLSEEGKEKAQKALTDRCLTQKELGKELGFSRETISKLFRGLPVDRQYFVKICEELGLEWDEIVAKSASQPAQDKKQQDSVSEIDVLVQEVREKRHDKIQDQCGTMRMLDISQPVALVDIYTDVNILEEITSLQWREISDLLQGFNPESDNFDRLGLGEVRQQRVPGLDAVGRYSKLMVLGKPGAGKTTFLQWVAIKCNLGEFQSNRVPIFIRLKNFTEDTRRDDSESRLLNFIIKEFRRCGIADKSVIETVLTQGRALILLDGLDEVSEEDGDEVVRQIRQFAEDYFKNQFLITCRIAAKKYRFAKFTNVEVADFNLQQVEAFGKKWFLTAAARNNAEEGEATAKLFIEKLKLPENLPIRELAVTPILLNLTCLVFLTKGKFPSKRAKLYEQGLDILLKKWDEERGIKRNEVYRYLSLENKIELLTHIAAITFAKSSYFFEQDEVERCIADYLHTLPNAQTNRLILKRDSNAILTSIEAQHGLLVERARGIYSFSHLTFQEYFTALAVINSFHSQSSEKSFSSITRKSWREVFFLATSMMHNADELMLSMKQRIDNLLDLDETIQKFLIWLSQKSLYVKVPYKVTAIRAFYVELSIVDHLNRQLIVLDTENLSDEFLSSAIDFNLRLNIDHACDFELNLDLELSYALSELFDKNFTFAVDALERACKRVQRHMPELKQSLQKLIHQTPDEYEDRLQFKRWWQANGKAWTDQLRSVMIKHRNIGHDWQFSKQQKKLLQQYYDANKLLVQCLNSDCEVSPEVRQEIEDTLLLPIVEMEKCQQRIL
jgi:predicted NACHT family NTPase